LQQEIDRRHAAGDLPEPASADFIRWLHREFYRDAPGAMLMIRSDSRTLRMMPGRFRDTPGEEVTVGRHQPPSSDKAAVFMTRFGQRYRLAPLGPGSRILAIAAAHHRFNYIHPFLDGNGRVSRLMSHAMALSAGIGRTGCGRCRAAWPAAWTAGVNTSG
jgi:Fic family protein